MYRSRIHWLALPFDLGLVDLVGVASVSSRRRFPRRGDSSTTFPTGGLAGVDDATGLNASIGRRLGDLECRNDTLWPGQRNSSRRRVPFESVQQTQSRQGCLSRNP
jgi:hypothetical protein